jgi:hypothetical protein
VSSRLVVSDKLILGFTLPKFWLWREKELILLLFLLAVRHFPLLFEGGMNDYKMVM